MTAPDVPTAAQREAIQRAAHHEAKARYGVGRDPVIRRVGFEEGAVLGAARVTPTREQIAAVLRRHNFDELLLGNVEWDGYTAVCACGWSSEEYKLPGDAHKAHSEHAAAHVLELITKEDHGSN